MCNSACVARPFTDQCIKARCFEYQTRLWLAPPAPLCWTDCMWSLSSLHTNCLPQKCLLLPEQPENHCVLFNSSPSHPLLARHAACRGSLGKQRSPCSYVQNLWLQQNTKEERDPVLSRGADIGFQIPDSYIPRHCSAVSVAEGVRKEGKIKVFLSNTCLFSSYSTEYKSFCLTVRRGSRLPSTTGLPLVPALGTAGRLAHFSGAIKAAPASRADSLSKQWFKFGEER